jgi:hypothetical protein
LAVFDADHPRPTDVTDAAGIRGWMTRTSEQLLADAADRPAIVRAALSAMIVDELPAAGEVEVIAHRKPPFTGGDWDAFMTRRGAGERVPVKAIFPAGWDGTTLLWSHPLGRRSASERDAAIERVLARRRAVVVIDAFLSGDFVPPRPMPEVSLNPSGNPRYAGYRLGYNRSVIAERAHDLLSAIALIRGWPNAGSIHLFAWGCCAPAALVARAVAGDAIDRAAIDLDEFDFDGITDDEDPRLLPGALKYGGVSGIAQACTSGRTLLCSMSVGSSSNVEGRRDRIGLHAMVGWLIAD